MSKPKWTPGPWRLGDDATGKVLTIWAAKPGMCITSVFDNRMGDDSPPMREAKANAKLIAVAPELAAFAERVRATIAPAVSGSKGDDYLNGGGSDAIAGLEGEAIALLAKVRDGS